MTNTPFRFMDLPVELRLEVYKHLVVVGKVFYTPDEFHKRAGPRFDQHDIYQQPMLSILRVSKAVHSEAEDLYLTQNLFVLPFRFNECVPFADNEALSAYRPLFSEPAIQRIRHVSVEINHRDVRWSVTMERSDWEGEENGNPGHYDHMTADQRLQIAHKRARATYNSADFDMVTQLEEMDALQTIEIDYTNAYCPVGCCRMIYISVYWAQLLSRLQSIRILGLRHKKEEDSYMACWTNQTGHNTQDMKDGTRTAWVMNTLSSNPEPHMLCVITFGNVKDPWAQWKMQ